MYHVMISAHISLCFLFNIFFCGIRPMQFLCFVSVSYQMGKQLNIFPFSVISSFYPVLGSPGGYMESIQHHLSVILPLGQEFQISASFTNEFQKALFSIVEFKNILNYIYYSLFKDFFQSIFLSYSLIFHCLVLISLYFCRCRPLTHYSLSLLCFWLLFLQLGFSQMGVDTAAQPFAHSSLIRFP